MLSQAAFKKTKARLATTYEKLHGAPPASAIPWAIIIDVVLKLLGGCFPTPPSGKDVKARATSNVADDKDYVEFGVRQALRSEYGFGAWRKYDGPGVAAAVLESAKASDEKDLDEVVAGAFDWDI